MSFNFSLITNRLHEPQWNLTKLFPWNALWQLRKTRHWNNMENVVHHRERNTKYKIVGFYVQKNSKEIKLSSKKF